MQTVNGRCNCSPSFHSQGFDRNAFPVCLGTGIGCLRKKVVEAGSLLLLLLSTLMLLLTLLSMFLPTLLMHFEEKNA